MKILSFKKNNKNSFGVLNDNGIVDAGPKLNKKYPNLKSILESKKIDLLKKIENDPIDYRIDDVDFLPPIPNAEKIICVGINYLGHIKETGREIPKYPVLFSRFIDSFFHFVICLKKVLPVGINSTFSPPIHFKSESTFFVPYVVK